MNCSPNSDCFLNHKYYLSMLLNHSTRLLKNLLLTIDLGYLMPFGTRLETFYGVPLEISIIKLQHTIHALRHYLNLERHNINLP